MQIGQQSTWVQVFDNGTGQTYYYNSQTGISQWEPPTLQQLHAQTVAGLHPNQHPNVSNMQHSHGYRYQPQNNHHPHQHHLEHNNSVPHPHIHPGHHGYLNPSSEVAFAQAQFTQSQMNMMQQNAMMYNAQQPFNQHMYQQMSQPGTYIYNCKDQQQQQQQQQRNVNYMTPMSNVDYDKENDEVNQVEPETEPEDRRCWGRPNRRRSVAKNVTIDCNNVSESRFRTTSSVDPKMIVSLAGTFNQSCALEGKNSDVSDSGVSSVALASESDLDEEESKSPLTPRGRANTTNTFYLASSISKPNAENQIRCVAVVLNAHMVSFEKSLGTYVESEQVKVFNDKQISPSTQEGTQVPSTENIVVFIKRVFRLAQMVEECIIMSLIYLERLLNAKKGKLALHTGNWQPIVLSCMVLASKVWDDLSMQNGDFSLICPSYSLKRINALEVALLELIEYNVRIPSSTYAKYYFQLRAMGKGLGIYSSEGEDGSEALNSVDAMRLENATLSRKDEMKSGKCDSGEGTWDDSTEEPIVTIEPVNAPAVSSSAKTNRESVEKKFALDKVRTRIRRKTTFEGASPEWMTDVHEKGYRFTAVKSVNLASLEQCVSLNYSGSM